MPSDWPRRGEAARRLGVSVSTLRRLEKDGTLPPRRDHRGHHRHDPALLEAYLKKHGRRSRKGSSRSSDAEVTDNELALMLADGKSPVEVLRRTKAQPHRLVVVRQALHRLTTGDPCTEGVAREELVRLGQYAQRLEQRLARLEGLLNR